MNFYKKQSATKIFFSFLILFYLIIICSISSKAQNTYVLTHDDSLALKEVIVEKYYVADSTDYIDTTGGALPKGSVTYRIYIGMKPGYKLQMVYGDPKHELEIKTTTKFFNNSICEAALGYNISTKEINKNSSIISIFRIIC